MSKGDNRLKVLYIIDILKNKSDEDHYVKTSEIIEALEAKNLSADRKSIYSYIESLIDHGMEIEKSKRGYRLVNRNFELAELKMLVDALGAFKTVPQKKTQDIIRKLGLLTSEYNRSQLSRQVFLENRIKSDNNSVIYNIDAIEEAINRNKRITFNYYRTVLKFGDEEKIKRVIKKDENGDNKLYRQSPFALLWKNENYYLVTFDSRTKDKRTFRVDRMLNVMLTGEKREGNRYFSRFDFAKYANKTFSMFNGEEYDVVLKVKNELIGVIIDRFGNNNIGLYRDDDDHFICTVTIIKSDLFFAWLSGFGRDIELKSPNKLRKEYSDYLKELLSMYKKK